MFFKLLKAERMKLKRSPVWIAFIIMPVIPAVLGTVNYLGNLAMLQSEWYSLWTQHTLFTCYFFLPILIGIYCSYIMRIEHNDHNWNKMLVMPVPRALIFLSKLTTVSFMILLSEIWIGVLFIISGTACGLSSPPLRDIAGWCCFGTLGGIVMAAVQLCVSMFIKSFALPVGIAFGGGISGLVLLAKGFGYIWPYSLMAYGMESNAPKEAMKVGSGPFAVICICYILLFIAAGSVIISKKDS